MISAFQVHSLGIIVSYFPQIKNIEKSISQRKIYAIFTFFTIFCVCDVSSYCGSAHTVCLDA